MFKYTAVIIEPREHKALGFVLNNFFINLSDEWEFILFHGRNNINFVYNLFDTTLKEFKHRIKLIQLEVDNLSLKQYSSICKNENLYKCINVLYYKPID